MNLQFVLAQLLTGAPVLLISIGVIVFALVRRSHHPMASAFAIAAFLLKILGVGTGIAMQGWIVAQSEAGAEAAAVANGAVVWGALQMVLHALFLILIAIAVFVGRGKTAPRS